MGEGFGGMSCGAEFREMETRSTFVRFQRGRVEANGFKDGRVEIKLPAGLMLRSGVTVQEHSSCW